MGNFMFFRKSLSTGCFLVAVICLVFAAKASAQDVQPKDAVAPEAPVSETPANPAAPAPSNSTQCNSNSPVDEKPVSAPVPVKPVAISKPVEKFPPGYEAAVKAFNEKKYPSAIAQFENLIKGGATNEAIHNYLAQCYYYQRAYSKAIKEYEWVAKNGKNGISLQHSAAKMARTLKCYMSGVCPENCVKANDPRWQTSPGHPGLWIKFNTPDGPHYLSRVHIGQTLTLHGGHPHAGERCPVCRGTGKVRALKDGDPL